MPGCVGVPLMRLPLVESLAYGARLKPGGNVPELTRNTAQLQGSSSCKKDREGVGLSYRSRWAGRRTLACAPHTPLVELSRARARDEDDGDSGRQRDQQEEALQSHRPTRVAVPPELIDLLSDPCQIDGDAAGCAP